MIVFLEVRSGPSAGKGVRLRSGQSVRVGRTQNSDFMIPADNHLSGRQFAIEFDELLSPEGFEQPQRHAAQRAEGWRGASTERRHNSRWRNRIYGGHLP